MFLHNFGQYISLFRFNMIKRTFILRDSRSKKQDKRQNINEAIYNSYIDETFVYIYDRKSNNETQGMKNTIFTESEI